MGAVTTIIKGTMSGQDVDNIVSWSTSGGDYSNADVQEIGDRVLAAWIGQMVPHLSNKYSVQSVHTVQLEFPYSTDSLGSATGAGTAPPMPPFVVARVRISTGVAGVQGRTGLSGLGNNAVQASNANFLETATQSEFNTAWHAFVTAVESVPSPEALLSVISRRTGGAPRVPPLAVVATGSSVQGHVGSRRSRLQ